MWVCENLGGPIERISRWSAEAAWKIVFPLKRRDSADGRSEATPTLPLLGIPDGAIRHAQARGGMITKREVRLIALAYLGLRPATCSGTWRGQRLGVAEAARLSPGLEVFAIERDPRLSRTSWQRPLGLAKIHA